MSNSRWLNLPGASPALQALMPKTAAVDTGPHWALGFRVPSKGTIGPWIIGFRVQGWWFRV